MTSHKLTGRLGGSTETERKRKIGLLGLLNNGIDVADVSDRPEDFLVDAVLRVRVCVGSAILREVDISWASQDKLRGSSRSILAH